MSSLQAAEDTLHVQALPAVNPYKYLINLEARTELEIRQLDLNQYPASVKTYLRLLGRNTRIEKIRDSYLKLSDPADRERANEKIAKAELAGGWWLLRLAKYPADGSFPVGLFFDPNNITAEAVDKCPQMPWLFNLRPEHLDEAFERGVTVDHVILPERYISPHGLSEYTRSSRSMFLSNVIIPLPEPIMDSNDPRWDSLVDQCHTWCHVLKITSSRAYDRINETNNEDLVLAARDDKLPLSLFDSPDRNLGWNKERDEAYDTYLREILGYEEDY